MKKRYGNFNLTKCGKVSDNVSPQYFAAGIFSIGLRSNVRRGIRHQ